jgi:hypothetical protein
MSDSREALRTRARENTGRVRPLSAGWFATIALVIAVGLGSFLFGMYISSRDLADTRALVQQLQGDAQKSKQGMIAATAALAALQVKTDKIAADLEAIRPAKDTYDFLPNQSLVLADGLLSIGLVGSPGNNGIVLNVNGARKPLSSGDVVQLDVDAKTSCRITVQSFDLFKAVVHAACDKQS